MIRFWSVALGGAAGALLRYGVYGLTQRLGVEASFPATLAVNLAGSFFIGSLLWISESSGLPPHFKAFLVTGILGAFTTFSALTAECFEFIRRGQTGLCFAYVTVSLVLGVALVFAGYTLARHTFPSVR